MGQIVIVCQASEQACGLTTSPTLGRQDAHSIAAQVNLALGCALFGRPSRGLNAIDDGDGDGDDDDDDGLPWDIRVEAPSGTGTTGTTCLLSIAVVATLLG